MLVTYPSTKSDLAHTIGGFIRDEIMLLPDQLWLTLGVRLSHNDFTGVEVQPNARLMWTPDAKNSAWMSVSRAVRTPSRGENDVRINTRTLPGMPFPIKMKVQGVSSFDSERLIAYELGYRHQLTSQASIDIAGFFNDYSRLRDLSFASSKPGSGFPQHFVLPILFNNNASAHSYGAEVSVDWRPYKNLRLQGSYNYINIHVDSADEFREIDSTTGGASKANPHHQLSLRSNYDLSEKLEMNLWLRYVSALPFYNIKDYVTMDAKLAWKPLRGVELSIVGQNLFSQHHRESQSDFIPSLPTRIPRGIYAGARWSF